MPSAQIARPAAADSLPMLPKGSARPACSRPAWRDWETGSQFSDSISATAREQGRRDAPICGVAGGHS